MDHIYGSNNKLITFSQFSVMLILFRSILSSLLEKKEFLCIGPVVSLSVNQSVTWSLPTLSDNLQLIFLVWSSASSRKK